MVQVLQPKNGQKPPSFLQSVLGGFAEGVPGAIEKYQQMSQQKQQQQAITQRYPELAGLPQELQKVVLSEMMKQKGKEGLLEKKQNFLNQILSGGQENIADGNVNDGGSLQENVGSGFNPENISDQDIIKAEAMGFKGLREAKNAKVKETTGKEKEKRRQFESDRDYHSKLAEPIISKAMATLQEAPVKKGLIDQQRRDIASGNTEGFLPWLTEQSGFEPYRNPESSRFKTATKQRFIEGLHSIGAAGARPNQFIEQQLVGAQATLGRDAESNMTVLDLEEFVDDLKNQRAKYELQLAEEDREKYGYPRNDIAIRADKKMEKYAEQRQDEMAYDIRRRHEDAIKDDQELIKEVVGKRVAPDTPLTVRMARILMIKNNDNEKKAQAEAKSLGFRIPSPQTYQRG